MDLSPLIKPSRSIEVITEHRDEWEKPTELILKTVIASDLIGDSFRIASPIYHGRVFLFREGHALTVVVTAPDADGSVLGIPCTVTGRFTDGTLSSLGLKITGEPRRIQRRKAFRVKVYNTYTFSIRGMDSTLTTKDISAKGMLALSPIPLHIGDTFHIRFDATLPAEREGTPAPQDGKCFTLRCKVLDSIYQKEIRRYLNRIEFEGVSEQASQAIIQYLYAKQAEIIKLDPKSSQKITDYFEHNDDTMDRFNAPVYRELQVWALITSLTFFVGLVMLIFAHPGKQYVLDYLFGFKRTSSWDRLYLGGSIGFSGLGIALSATGLIYNIRSVLKQKAEIKWSLSILLALSSAVFLYAVLAPQSF